MSDHKVWWSEVKPKPTEMLINAEKEVLSWAFGENNAIFKFIESLRGNSLSWKRSEVRIGLTADPLETAGIHCLSQGHTWKVDACWLWHFGLWFMSWRIFSAVALPPRCFKQMFEFIGHTSEKVLIQLSLVCVGFHTHKDPFCPMGLFQQVSCRHVSNASGIPYNTQSETEWPPGPWWPSARGDRWGGYDLES